MAKKNKDIEVDESAEGEPDGHIPVRIADHPRAVRSISRARAWGAVIGFGVAAFFGDRIGLPFVDLVVRSILIGAASYLVVWAGAQAVWRQIVFAEIAIKRKEALEKQQDLIDAIEPPGGEPRA